MPAITTSSKYVVQSRSSRWSRLALCLLAFLATGAAVYRMALKTAGDPRATSASATIFQQTAPINGETANGPNGPSLPDPLAIEREILSEENLRTALGRLALPPGDSGANGPAAEMPATIDQIARTLRVTTTEVAEPERALRITISSNDEDPNRAVRLVNTLAEAYANQHGPSLKAALGQDYLDAQGAAERARQNYLDARGRFDDFVERHFHEQQALAERRANSRHSPPPLAGPPPPEVRPPEVPRQLENPEWVELQRQLAELERGREQLLLARTPLHPEVRDAEVRIVRVRERLETVPDHLVEPEPRMPPEQNAAPEAVVESRPSTFDGILPQETVEAWAGAVRTFRDLKAALEQARRNYDRLAAAERRAWEQQIRSARVEWKPADSFQVSRPGDGSPSGLFGALAAALVVACGVGLISSGFDIDPPLHTASQVERAFVAPIVGQVPATGTSSAEAEEDRPRPPSRLLRILSGTLLIAVCFGILVIVF